MNGWVILYLRPETHTPALDNEPDENSARSLAALMAKECIEVLVVCPVTALLKIDDWLEDDRAMARVWERIEKEILCEKRL